MRIEFPPCLARPDRQGALGLVSDPPPGNEPVGVGRVVLRGVVRQRVAGDPVLYLDGAQTQAEVVFQDDGVVVINPRKTGYVTPNPTATVGNGGNAQTVPDGRRGHAEVRFALLPGAAMTLSGWWESVGEAQHAAPSLVPVPPPAPGRDVVRIPGAPDESPLRLVPPNAAAMEDRAVLAELQAITARRLDAHDRTLDVHDRALAAVGGDVAQLLRANVSLGEENRALRRALDELGARVEGLRESAGKRLDQLQDQVDDSSRVDRLDGQIQHGLGLLVAGQSRLAAVEADVEVLRGGVHVDGETFASLEDSNRRAHVRLDAVEGHLQLQRPDLVVPAAAPGADTDEPVPYSFRRKGLPNGDSA